MIAKIDPPILTEIFEGQLKVETALKNIMKLFDSLKSERDLMIHHQDMLRFIAYLRDIIVFYFHFEQYNRVFEENGSGSSMQFISMEHYHLIRELDQLYENTVRLGISDIQNHQKVVHQMQAFTEKLKNHNQIKKRIIQKKYHLV